MSWITDCHREAAHHVRKLREYLAMRPMTETEARELIARLEAEAAALRANAEAVMAGAEAARETGRVAHGDTVEARGMRNLALIGDARRSAWGAETLALQCEMRAEALRTQVVGRPEGEALRANIAYECAMIEYYVDAVVDADRAAGWPSDRMRVLRTLTAADLAGYLPA